MRRIAALSFGLVVLAGCTAVLGSFEVGSSSTTQADGGGTDGSTTDGGGNVGPDGNVPVDAGSTPILIDGGMSNCTLDGTKLLVDTGSSLVDFVRLYRLPSGVIRIASFTATSVKVQDLANGSLKELGNEPTYYGLYALKHVGTSWLFLSASMASKMRIDRLDDDKTAFVQTGLQSPITQQWTSAGFVNTNALNANTFLAMATSDAGSALFGETEGAQTPTLLTADSTGASKLHVLSVQDEKSNAYIFTPGEIANDSLSPTEYVTPDNPSGAASTTQSHAVGEHGTQLIDVSEVTAGTTWGVSILKVGNQAIELHAGTYPTLANMETSNLPIIASFAAAGDFPVNGDIRWEPTSQFLLAGGAANEPGLNLIWYDATSNQVRETFTGPNRLLLDTTILAASATVNGSGKAGLVTIDLAWVEGAPNTKNVFHQSVTCKF